MRADVFLSLDCVATGSYRLYNSREALQASGQFKDGRRDGVWTFWDSQGSKIVELSYERGMRQGGYHMWYGSFAYPTSTGNRNIEGEFLGDREHGKKWSWWPRGSRQCEVDFSNGEATHARCWTESGEALTQDEAWDAARRQSEADAAYIATLDEVVERSVWDRCKGEVHVSGELPRGMLRD